MDIRIYKEDKIKKIFGNINLTWKKLILFSVIAGVYTAVMAILPITDNTSFRDIAIQLEWWIVFGIIIICNSKSAKDSALKCFVFFLISQPLVYLIQVPFSYLGWRLFMYYKYWFIWTLLTIPMGYIGYNIKKKNILSVIILLPMLILLAYLGWGYLISALESFPHHILSSIFCFASILIIILNLFDNKKLRLLAICLTFIPLAIIVFMNRPNSGYEVVRSISEYDLKLKNNVYVSKYSGTKHGNVEIIPFDESYNVKLIGLKGGKYTFELSDDNNTYSFEYYYDKEENTVLLKLKK